MYTNARNVALTPTYIPPRLRRTTEDIVVTQLLLNRTNTHSPRHKAHNPDSCHTIRHTLNTLLRHTIQKSGVPASEIGGIEVANVSKAPNRLRFP